MYFHLRIAPITIDIFKGRDVVSSPSIQGRGMEELGV